MVRAELSRDVSSLIDEASDDVVKQASLVGRGLQGSQRAPHHHYYGTGRHCTIRTHDFSPKYHAYDGPSASCTEDDLHEEDRRLCKRSPLKEKPITEKNNEALEKERRKSELSLQRETKLSKPRVRQKRPSRRSGVPWACELKEERCQREKLELAKKCKRLSIISILKRRPQDSIR